MLMQDVRYALRQVRQAPGFALTVVMTLALSVGVATAVFCVIDTVILRPLPYAHPERIVSIQSMSRSGYTQPASWPSFRDERAQVHAFAAFAGYNNFFKATVETPTSGPVLLDTVHSSDNFFQVLIPALRSAIREVDPTVPFKEASTMTEVVSETLVFERMESWLFGIFAGLALLLALVGLHGLVSHEVEQSRRDIGVRMALGASRQSILAMVLRRVAWMLAGGTAAGIVLTIFARRLIGIVIYFEAQKEAGGLLFIALLLVAVGLLASLLPAARAASIEPMQALRTE